MEYILLSENYGGKEEASSTSFLFLRDRHVHHVYDNVNSSLKKYF